MTALAFAWRPTPFGHPRISDPLSETGPDILDQDVASTTGGSDVGSPRPDRTMPRSFTGHALRVKQALTDISSTNPLVDFSAYT